MVKKLISLLALSPLLVQAQITISVQLPSSGMIQKDQLWNLVLANSGNTTMEVSVLLNLQEAATGQSVLSAGTRTILLPKGTKMLSASDVQPVQYNYNATGLSNYLPLGSYIACYSVARRTGERMESLGDECVRITINPLSPPLLNTPADKSVLRTALPQLSWTPPSPLDMFDNLSYDISIAEVMEGQSPADAILYNTPVYVKSHSKQTFENYPSSYSKLQEGKTYAWLVTARNGENYAVATEVWTFSIAEDSLTTQTENASYILLKDKNEQAGVGYLSSGVLQVKYYSFDAEHETAVRFLRADGKLMGEKKQKIIYGDNFLRFKLGNSYRKGEVYFIEIKDRQNHTYTAAFSIN